MRALRLIIWTLIVTLVACARNEETLPEETTKVKPSAFEGNWSLPCQRDGSPLAFPPGELVQRFYIIEGSNFTFIQRGFESPREGEEQCSANRLAYSLIETGVFALKKSTAGMLLADDWENWSPGNWGTISSEGRRFSMIPSSAQTVMLWNANKVCGNKTNADEEWKIGKSRGVSNKFCFGVKMFSTASETRAIRYDRGEDGKVSMTFGTIPEDSDDPVFNPSLKFSRIDNLPFTFKNPNQKNRNLIKGKQGNQ